MSGVQMTDYTVHTQRALLCCARVWIEARRHWNAMMLSAQLSWLLEHHRLLPPDDVPRGSLIVTTLALGTKAN